MRAMLRGLLCAQLLCTLSCTTAVGQPPLFSGRRLAQFASSDAAGTGTALYTGAGVGASPAGFSSAAPSTVGSTTAETYTVAASLVIAGYDSISFGCVAWLARSSTRPQRLSAFRRRIFLRLSRRQRFLRLSTPSLSTHALSRALQQMRFAGVLTAVLGESSLRRKFMLLLRLPFSLLRQASRLPTS